MRLHMGQQLLVDALRGAPQRQLAQRRQVAGREVALDGALRRLRHIDFSRLQPLDQVVGREVDDLDVVGAIDDRIRDGLAARERG